MQFKPGEWVAIDSTYHYKVIDGHRYIFYPQPYPKVTMSNPEETCKFCCWLRQQCWALVNGLVLLFLGSHALYWCFTGKYWFTPVDVAAEPASAIIRIIFIGIIHIFGVVFSISYLARWANQCNLGRR